MSSSQRLASQLSTILAICGIELAKRLRRDLPDLPMVLNGGCSHILAQEGAEGMKLLGKPYSAN